MATFVVKGNTHSISDDGKTVKNIKDGHSTSYSEELSQESGHSWSFKYVAGSNVTIGIDKSGAKWTGDQFNVKGHGYAYYLPLGYLYRPKSAGSVEDGWKTSTSGDFEYKTGLPRAELGDAFDLSYDPIKQALNFSINGEHFASLANIAKGAYRMAVYTYVRDAEVQILEYNVGPAQEESKEESEASQNEVDALKKEREQKDAAIGQMKTEKADLAKKSEQELQAKQAQLQQNKAEIDKLTAQKQSHEEAAQSAQQQHKQEIEQLKQQNEASLAAKEAQLQQNKAELDKLTAQKNASLKNSRAENEQRTNELQQHITALQTQNDEMAALQQEMQNLRGENERLQQNNIEEAEQLKRQKEAESQKFLETEQKHQQESSQLKDAVEELKQQKQADLEQSQQKLKQTERNHQQETRELKHLHEKNEQQFAEQLKVEQEKSQAVLAAQAQQIQNANDACSGRIQQAREQIQRRIAEHEQRMGKVAEKMSATQDEVQALREEKDDLDEEFRHYKEENGAPCQCKKDAGRDVLAGQVRHLQEMNRGIGRRSKAIQKTMNITTATIDSLLSDFRSLPQSTANLVQLKTNLQTASFKNQRNIDILGGAASYEDDVASAAEVGEKISMTVSVVTERGAVIQDEIKKGSAADKASACADINEMRISLKSTQPKDQSYGWFKMERYTEILGERCPLVTSNITTYNFAVVIFTAYAKPEQCSPLDKWLRIGLLVAVMGWLTLVGYGQRPHKGKDKDVDTFMGFLGGFLLNYIVLLLMVALSTLLPYTCWVGEEYLNYAIIGLAVATALVIFMTDWLNSPTNLYVRSIGSVVEDASIRVMRYPSAFTVDASYITSLTFVDSAKKLFIKASDFEMRQITSVENLYGFEAWKRAFTSFGKQFGKEIALEVLELAADKAKDKVEEAGEEAAKAVEVGFEFVGNTIENDGDYKTAAKQTVAENVEEVLEMVAEQVNNEVDGEIGQKGVEMAAEAMANITIKTLEADGGLKENLASAVASEAKDVFVENVDSVMQYAVEQAAANIDDQTAVTAIEMASKSMQHVAVNALQADGRLKDNLKTAVAAEATELIQQGVDEIAGQLQTEDAELNAVVSVLAEKAREMAEETLNGEKDEEEEKYGVPQASRSNGPVVIEIRYESYRQWDYLEVGAWILGLNPQQFKQYEQALLAALKENQVDGVSLPDVEKYDLKEFGIRGLKDRMFIYEQIQELVNPSPVALNDILDMSAAASAANQEQKEKTETTMIVYAENEFCNRICVFCKVEKDGDEPIEIVGLRLFQSGPEKKLQDVGICNLENDADDSVDITRRFIQPTTVHHALNQIILFTKAEENDDNGRTEQKIVGIQCSFISTTKQVNYKLFSRSPKKDIEEKMAQEMVNYGKLNESP